MLLTEHGVVDSAGNPDGLGWVPSTENFIGEGKFDENTITEAQYEAGFFNQVNLNVRISKLAAGGTFWLALSHDGDVFFTGFLRHEFAEKSLECRTVLPLTTRQFWLTLAERKPVKFMLGLRISLSRARTVPACHLDLD